MAVFGPQHGITGHTQDNMIEWEGEGNPHGPRVHSLYGEVRKPTAAMLAGIDLLVVDLFDVGARYYTFAWTMSLCLEACGERGVPVLILDRPNPLGRTVEGPVLDPALASFVGLYPVATRHGMTLGELARWVNGRLEHPAELSVLEVSGWDGGYFDRTGLPWVMPSPNMPTLETAVVYPGGCLLEGTNLSEGRGTTRPFEIFGAPYLDGRLLADGLNGEGLPGVHFRALEFEPTFNKHVGKVCGGCFVHVTDREAFRPVLTYAVALREVIRQVGIVPSEELARLPECPTFLPNAPEVSLPGFSWRRPPYEYEYTRRPIDLLTGSVNLTQAIESGATTRELKQLTQIGFDLQC